MGPGQHTTIQEGNNFENGTLMLFMYINFHYIKNNLSKSVKVKFSSKYIGCKRQRYTMSM